MGKSPHVTGNSRKMLLSTPRKPHYAPQPWPLLQPSGTARRVRLYKNGVISRLPESRVRRFLVSRATKAKRVTSNSTRNVKITIIGIIVFLVLVVVFFAWFGGPPTFPDASSMTRRGIGRSWLYCAILFVAGTGTACFGDKDYGKFPPTSLRWLFIVFGVLIMVVSAAWMHLLTKTPSRSPSALLPPTFINFNETGNAKPRA